MLHYQTDFCLVIKKECIMGVRIITGVILIALVIFWLFFADFPIYTMGALLIYMVGAYEMGPLLKFKSRIPFVVIAMVAATTIFFFAQPGQFVEPDFVIPLWIKWMITASLPFWCIAIFLVKQYPHIVKWHDNLVINTVIGLFLLVPFLLGLLVMRATDFATSYNTGAFLVLSVMALVWAADSGAYFTGRAVGKTPLMPEVSPKKTREGLLGGIVLALVVLFLGIHYKLYASYGEDQLAILASGFFAIVFSVYGDLMESMLKRLVGIKDSGKIFPGHGGMLDRIDSQLAAIPVFLSLNWIVSGELIHVAG